jgi:hypothetical protein
MRQFGVWIFKTKRFINICFINIFMSYTYCKKCGECIGMGLGDLFKNPDKKTKQCSIESLRKGVCKACYESAEEEYFEGFGELIE